jgi:hypothetical protein
VQLVFGGGGGGAASAALAAEIGRATAVAATRPPRTTLRMSIELLFTFLGDTSFAAGNNGTRNRSLFLTGK